jgi:hypothetical protein
MKNIKLITNKDEVIEYDNIVIETVETKTVPEKVEVITKNITVKDVKEKIVSIDERIEKLIAEKAERESMLVEADKVTKAVKRV